MERINKLEILKKQIIKDLSKNENNKENISLNDIAE